MAQRISAVDIGSNTIHHIIAEEQKPGQIVVLDRQVELLRFGADIAANGNVGEAKVTQAALFLQKMSNFSRSMGVVHSIGIATEGVRAAQNAPAILTALDQAYGSEIVMISGLEEAVLSYWGATGQQCSEEISAVADLGGGSCEFVVGRQNALMWARSIPLGSGRLIDQVPISDPPSQAELSTMASIARAAVNSFATPPVPTDLVAVGGTASAISRILHPDHAAAIIAQSELQALLQHMQLTPSRELASQTDVDIDRLRLVIGGTVALDAILSWACIDRFHVSDYGVREGAAMAWLHAGDAWREYVQNALPRQQ